MTPGTRRLIMPTYVVEHLDEEFYRWSKCEYLSMIEYVSPRHVIFSNANFEAPGEWNHLTNFTVLTDSIIDMGIPIDSICLLDSESPNVLAPADATRFTHFLFGGILGNTDEFDFDRTKILREMGFPTRNLGLVQMTTDTAVKTTHVIIEKQVPFEEIRFIDRPSIKSSSNESLLLNFRFLADVDGNPLIAAGITELMLEDGDDVFDFDRLE